MNIPGSKVWSSIRSLTIFCTFPKSLTDMCTTQFFSNRFNSLSESFDSDSTRDSQWLSRVDSNQLMPRNGFPEFDSNRLMTQMAFQTFDLMQPMDQKLCRIWIQIKLRLKRLFRILVQIDS